MMESIGQAISKSYNLRIHTIEPTTGGWSADAYIAKTNAAEYFVKRYDKQKSSVQPWIARMELYMPVALWLYENTMMRDWMVSPILTTSGEYKIENESSIVLVFPLLSGITIGDACLNTEQIRQLAEALAKLHSYGSQIPVLTKPIKDDYALPFSQELTALFENGHKPAGLQKALHLYESGLKKGLETLQALSISLREERPNDVLCHTDVHGWNLMWTDKIVLIDWEGLCLAPAEADLFAFTDGFFFDYAGEEFMPTYRSIRKDFVLNEKAMPFYRLRRRLEDISAFAHSIQYDNPSPQDAASALQYMEKECITLSKML